MLPRDLKPEQFRAYPPEARKLAVNNLRTLQQLPLSFLPNLLSEVIELDYKFPVERQRISKEMAMLGSLTPAQMQEWFGSFRDLSLSIKLEHFDWLDQPAQFVEQLSAHLWSTHQLDAFRQAAKEYGNRLQAAVAPDQPVISRLGIAIIGQGLDAYDGQLFRDLREHGTFFSHIKPENGIQQLMKGVAARAQAHPVPYAHWYVEGGQAVEHAPMLTHVSYQALEPKRIALLNKMQAEIKRPGMGPEELRTILAALQPADIGFDSQKDLVLNRFQLKLLTEGSGTQVFSTTFVQWTAREALRRAQPLTLLVRFGPRQRQRPMNELLANIDGHSEPDLVGSLVDADMGAYYNWINQQRLPGAEYSSFIAWFEGSSRAVALGPPFARGATSSATATLEELASWAVG
ncbi:hypothetical protein [Terriglobus albidus]|uniref:hypothetical protein n=1 Tax=Terriglobus albidus TaxID=1592106 RepID=UPI0021E014C3|nr:hypothetical protein [Terriglobus albidus]